MKKPKLIIISILLSTSFCLNVFAGEWKQDNNGWKYQEDDGSYPVSSWKNINNNWYYFNEGGYMLSDTTTPDGYNVSKSGEWIKTQETIDVVSTGKKYTFEKAGKWVINGDISEGEYVYYPNTQMKESIISGSSSLNCNFNYIKVYKDDIINPGTYVPVSVAGELDITKEGVFLVGRDVKAGTYNLTPFKYDGTRLIISMCTVFNSIPSSKDESAPQKNVDQDFYVSRLKNKTVTVKDGQYIQIIGCSADFVRP